MSDFSLSPSAHRPLRVAIVGTGIAGLSTAWHLATQTQQAVALSLFEANDHFGGHAHAVDVQLAGHTFSVDTGFLVFNHRTYPGLVSLFKTLQVPTAPANMGFSVQLRDAQGASKLEWAGNNLNSVFADRKQLLSPRFYGMLRDIVRFNRLATQLATESIGQHDPVAEATVRDFLETHRFGAAFTEQYFLPMIASIWSCPTQQMLAFPMRSMALFCHNHGLLQIHDRPQWYTVAGSSRHYVERLLGTLAQTTQTHLNTPVRAVLRDAEGITVLSALGAQRFDALVLATHPQQALALLGSTASVTEKNLLGAIRYQTNRGVLHTDLSMMPVRRRAWAAWNYERSTPHGAPSDAREVCLHYWLNALQPLPVRQPLLLSLNPLRKIDPASVLGEYAYEHPVFDARALHAQSQLDGLQGAQGLGQHTWYAGAWFGHGFHEDGFQAGRQAAESLLAKITHVRHDSASQGVSIFNALSVIPPSLEMAA